MPGISDRSSLRDTILDSIVLGSSTLVRLGNKGLRDPRSAVRLRDYEYKKVKERDPATIEAIQRECVDALKERRSGNYYVYRFMRLVMELAEKRELYLTLREASVEDSFNLQGLLMSSKLPVQSWIESLKDLPEGHSKYQARYITLRSIMALMIISHSKAGKYRGSLQAKNVKYSQSAKFLKEADTWEETLMKKLEGTGFTSHCSYHRNHPSGMHMICTRLSALIYFRLEYEDFHEEFLFTPNHYERCLDFIKQYTNLMLGLNLAYGMGSGSLGAEVSQAARQLLRQLVKIGMKDDLAPGEAGKAITDLYKAKLSQTEELPWDNFRLLLGTYSDKRRENAEYLWDYFYDNKFDPDIMLNISFVWKLCPQPDSDIRSDFNELTAGLQKPNEVSDEAAEHIELAFRRAYFVGALREKRQPQVFADEGYTVHSTLIRLCKLSRVSESDLREVTFSMMKGVKVIVPEVFPSVRDTSHLTFKDKSSATSGLRVRAQINKRKSLEKDFEDLYDEALRLSAQYHAEEFLTKIRVNQDEDYVDNMLRATANDILSSIDEDLSEVFREAEYKYKSIVKSLRNMGDAYGSDSYLESLRQWAKDNPELLINTGTEPKLGEVHKRTVRIFYMFEKGMKTFLSQFERMSRLMDHYIKGAEIVKGDRAREKHMNILSSAYKSVREGLLSYQILFDLSKFSQKFNHKIIDAASKVIGEACDYPDYAYISDIFKAAFLFVSARNVDDSFVGVLGCFEGFLNFLWTGIHATVMDIALRNCGRSGDLAAYSDDGLLMFTMSASLTSPREDIHNELKETVNNIITTYKDYGLDFNLGKTIISRTLAEFLGIIQYKGKRFPTWVKELSKLGTTEGRKIISGLCSEVVDISAQMEALIKAGMPPYAATYMGLLEVSLGPGRRLVNDTHSALEGKGRYVKSKYKYLVPAIFLCLNSSWGGVRVPDTISMMTTADFNPISEMIQDLLQLSINHPEVNNMASLLSESIEPSDDYVSLLQGGTPINTKGLMYGNGYIHSQVTGHLKTKFTSLGEHPLSRSKLPGLHDLLEKMTNVSPTIIASLTRYIASVIEYNKIISPFRSNSVTKLLDKNNIRRIQSSDTKAFNKSINTIIDTLLSDPSISLKDIAPIDLYRKSYPKVEFGPSVPSYRKLCFLSKNTLSANYTITMKGLGKTDNKGTTRLLNSEYCDDLAPPLVTSDVNIQHLNQAPDVVSHCIRGIYAEVVSAASQGHNILPLANEIISLNADHHIPENIISAVRDMRKIAVANRKKHIHRVHWSMSTKSNITLVRSHLLNTIMSINSNINYSLIVSVALAHIHLVTSSIDLRSIYKRILLEVDPQSAADTKIAGMEMKEGEAMSILRPLDLTPLKGTIEGNIIHAVSGEVSRSVDNLRLDIMDNMILGRMNMLSDFKSLGDKSLLTDPLRYALVWSLISKLDGFITSVAGTAGVAAMKTRSSKLDSVPSLLANYAIIYRVFRSCRKGDLAKAKTDNSIKEMISENSVRDTLYAASELGIVHTLDIGKLRSKRCANIYQSIVAAENCNIVFYSLDADPEDYHSKVVSHSRANAVGRVIDARISAHFKEHKPCLEVDLIRFIMMVIRGSVRGSVHREEPFNRGVIIRWVGELATVGECIYMSLPEKYLSQRGDGSQGQWKDIPTDIVHEAHQKGIESYLARNRWDDMLIPGDVTQYNQATQYIANQIKWGYWPDFWQALVNLGPGNRRRCQKVINSVIEEYITPMITMVRTISYSTAEAAIQNASLNKVPNTYNYDPLERNVQMAIDDYFDSLSDDQKGGFSNSNLVSSPPNDNYRQDDGPLIDFDFEFRSPGLSDYHISLLNIYAIALPLLLSSGKSSLKAMIDYGINKSLFDRNIVEDVIRSYSIPVIDSGNGYEMVVFKGLSERELIDSLRAWSQSSSSEALVVVELPPAAHTVSIGLASLISSYRLSYMTSAVSSDFEGFSIYSCAIIDPKTLSIPLTNHFSSNEHMDLGEMSVDNLVKQITLHDTTILPRIVLAPFHQAGLPVDLKVYCNDKLITYSIEEELIDQLSVSFIESGKPLESLIQVARLPPDKSAYFAKALSAKKLPHSATVRAIIAAAYYHHAIFQHIPAKDFIEAFTSIINSDRHIDHKENTFRYLLDPLAMLQGVSASDLPIKTQMFSREIPDESVPPHNLHKKLDRRLEDMISVTSSSLLPAGKHNPLPSYFRSKESLGTESASEILALTTPDDDDDETVFIAHDTVVKFNTQSQPLSFTQSQYMEDISAQDGANRAIEETDNSSATLRPDLATLLSNFGTDPVVEPELDLSTEEGKKERLYRLCAKDGLPTSTLDDVLAANSGYLDHFTEVEDDLVVDAIVNASLDVMEGIAPAFGVK